MYIYILECHNDKEHWNNLRCTYWLSVFGHIFHKIKVSVLTSSFRSRLLATLDDNTRRTFPDTASIFLTQRELTHWLVISRIEGVVRIRVWAFGHVVKPDGLGCFLFSLCQVRLVAIIDDNSRRSFRDMATIFHTERATHALTCFPMCDAGSSDAALWQRWWQVYV